jgi:hypothetical protein
MKKLLLMPLVLVMCWVVLKAQPKALGQPLPYIRPTDFSEDLALYKNYIEAKHKKSNDNGWLVFSERNNNSVYDKPNGKVIREIEIDRFFYVTQEKEDYIKIAQADGVEKSLELSNFKKEIGWIKKENMLLWTSSLINSEIKTPKKVILINKEIHANLGASQNEESKIQVYDSPSSSKKLSSIPAFSVCYVLKKDVSNHRLLLSYSRNISTLNIKKMIGWIDEDRCLTWDNGLAIEANDNEAAIKERMDSVSKKFKVFNSENYALQNNELGVIFRQDPISDEINEVSKSNIGRYNGNVFRVPLLGITIQNNLKTGVFIPTILDRYQEKGEVKIYSNGFIPLQYPYTKHRLVQFVILMNETDLLEYKRILNNNLQSSLSYQDKRKALFFTYQSLIFYYAGEGKFKDKKIGHWTYKDILKMILGDFENIILNDNQLDFLLDDLLDDKKISNERIDTLLLKLKEVDKNIENISNSKTSLEFSFKNPSGEISYWIKIEDIIF